MGKACLGASLALVLHILAGDCVIAQSSDWTVLDSVETSVFYSFLDLDCSSPMRCAYVADSGSRRSVARITFDGGQTWQSVAQDDLDIETGYLPRRYLSVAAPDDGTVVILIAENLVIATQDTGRTWDSTVFDHPKGRLRNVEFTGPEVGYVAGPRHWSYVTLDAGKTWIRTDSIEEDLAIASVHVAPTGGVFVLLARDSIRRISVSLDSGRTWTRRDAPNYIRDLEFANNELGWGVGGVPSGEAMNELDYIVRTTDGGITWTDVMRSWNDPAYGLGSVSFADSLHGLITGSGGKIFHSSDSGESWMRQAYDCDTLVNTCNVGKVQYESPDIAYAIGTIARLLKFDRTSEVHLPEGSTGGRWNANQDAMITTDYTVPIPPSVDLSKQLLVDLYSLNGSRILHMEIDHPNGLIRLPETLSAGTYAIVVQSWGIRYSALVQIAR